MYVTELSSAIATTPTKCDRVLPLLTDSRIHEQKLVGHRYFVDLDSLEYELQDDYPVPKSHKTVDVLVVEPTEKAIRELVANCGWLQNYKIVQIRKPAPDFDEEAPF